MDVSSAMWTARRYPICSDDAGAEGARTDRMSCLAMFRFSETNGMGIELRCKADARPSMTERKFGLYNFHVIVGNNENK